MNNYSFWGQKRLRDLHTQVPTNCFFFDVHEKVLLNSIAAAPIDIANLILAVQNPMIHIYQHSDNENTIIPFSVDINSFIKKKRHVG